MGCDGLGRLGGLELVRSFVTGYKFCNWLDLYLYKICKAMILYVYKTLGRAGTAGTG